MIGRPSTSVTSTCFEADTEYSGQEITEYSTTSAYDCHSYCLLTNACSHFTVANDVCVLTPSGASRISTAQATSGTINCCYENGIDYGHLGNLYHIDPTIQPVQMNSPQECAEYCNSVGQCMYFSFGYGYCYPKYTDEYRTVRKFACSLQLYVMLFFP